MSWVVILGGFLIISCLLVQAIWMLSLRWSKWYYVKEFAIWKNNILSFLKKSFMSSIFTSELKNNIFIKILSYNWYENYQWLDHLQSLNDWSFTFFVLVKLFACSYQSQLTHTADVQSLGPVLVFAMQ